MKKYFAMATPLLLAPLIATSANADPSVSANIGVMSDYFYRGIFQADSVANAGVDLEMNGFSIGTWVADVDDGLEVDVYGSYGIELEGDFSVSAGFTGYYYTGEFDDTYQELNLGAAWKYLSIDYAVGEYDNFQRATEDYDFLSLTAEYNGAYAKFGTFGKDFNGDYWELGYGTEIAGFNVSAALIISDEDLSGTFDAAGNPDTDESLVFSISKTLDIL